MLGGPSSGVLLASRAGLTISGTLRELRKHENVEPMQVRGTSVRGRVKVRTGECVLSFVRS